MNQDKIQELTRLLREAMIGLEIRARSGDRSSSLPMDVYRAYLQQRRKSYWADFNPYIVNEAIKSKLLDFIRVEFAQFIREDRILSASFFLLGGPTNGFPLESLLEQLLKITIVRGIEGAVSAFDRCTKETHGSVQYMALLEGITLETEIQVFEGIRLVPLPSSTSELPRYLPNLSFAPSGPSQHSLFGKTVLIVDCSVSPIFHKPFLATTMQEYEEQEERVFQVQINSADFPNFKVQDFPLNFLCQALSFACNSPVQIALIWKFLAEDELYNLSFGIGGGFSMSHGPFGSSTEVGKTQIEEAKRLYRILVNLDSNVREKLRIPIDGWIKSKTHKGPVDKIIDLAIAFEALYVLGRTKISFQLRHNASWYLGKNEEHRKALMTKFKEIYDCRSDAVHEGKLDEKVKFGGKRIPTSEFIAKVQDLCRQSIIKIMEDGRFPDWKSLNAKWRGGEQS